MQRGVLLINQSEKVVFSDMLVSSSVSSVLYNKIQALLDDQVSQELQLEVSEEEVDSILDYLGIPQKDEKQEVKTLREKSGQLLRQMRGR